MSAEADVEYEVTQLEMQEATSCPVHDPREQDDGKDEQNDPREEHHDAGNRVPGHGSGSSHGRAATRLRLSYSIQITAGGCCA
jgi:hypothetical protein